jgi:16S rRNA (uracil1498-N3)-methyltransferase
MEALSPGSSLRLSGDESKYIARVLRLIEGDKVILSCADGPEYHSTIVAIEKKSVLLNIESIDETNRESRLDITLCQSLPKSKKMDLIIQKCTELGVRRFIPFTSARSISRPEGKETTSKLKRWETIALEAARQCGRTFIPPVDDVIRLDDLLKDMSEIDGDKVLKLIPWESEDNKGLSQLAGKEVERAVLLIGPEGGFSNEEVDRAKTAGFVPISLGKRLLRTETAGFASVSMLQYVWGDMG